MKKMKEMMKKMEEDAKKGGGKGGGAGSNAEVERLKKMLEEKNNAMAAQLNSEGQSSAGQEEAKMMQRNHIHISLGFQHCLCDGFFLQNSFEQVGYELSVLLSLH